MFATEWLALPISRLITLTLLHFVWQGFVVAAMLLVMVEACRVRRVGARYACSLAALVTMVLSPLATLGVLIAQRDGGSELLIGGLDFANASPPGVVSLWGYCLQRAEPVVLVAWCCGVALFGGRLLTGAVGVARLRRSALPLPLKFVAVVEQLGQRLRMNAAGLVMLSQQVTDAMAVGLVGPLVLIPAAWVTEMPLEMLEAVIAHELAHLARRDLWVNLLQRIVETVLFYHPAVWWLSRRLRMERELCADDLAVMATGKRLEYAQALEQIAGERLADIRPALAAFLRGENDMRLLQRVRNVLKQSPEERSRLWPAGLAALALPLGLWAATAWSSRAIADDDRDDDKKPAIKRERAERDEAKRAAERLERDKKEAEKRATVEKVRSRYASEDSFRDPKQLGLAEVREERYTIVRDGQPAEERLESVTVARDGKPLTVDKERNRYIRENSNRDGKKPEVPEVREERYTIVRDGKAEQIVDKVIVMKDGKPVTVAVPREQREAANDHRLDELTTLVKQLSRNVERLQDEVSHLRAQKQGEPSYRIRRDDEDRSSLERSKRELQENIERAALAKHIASEKAEVEARAAKQQAEAARRVATDQKEAAERKLRKVEEEKRSTVEPREPKERTRAEQGRSDEERDLLPRRRESSNSDPREGDEQSQLDLRRRELKQAQEQLETFRRQVVDREKLLYELAQKQGEGTGQRVQKEIRQKLEAENQEIAKRAAKEKELAAAAKEIEAARQRAEAARKAIEDQIRKLKEDAAGDKTSAERQAIEEKVGKLREGVNEIEASGAKTEVRRKSGAIHPDQFRVAPDFGFRIDVPAMGSAPLAFDFAFPVGAKTEAKRKLIDDQIHKLKELKEGQVEPAGLPELDEDLFNEVKMQRLMRNEQALLNGPGLQPKPVSRPAIGR